jgi:hypothetical protein
LKGDFAVNQSLSTRAAAFVALHMRCPRRSLLSALARELFLRAKRRPLGGHPIGPSRRLQIEPDYRSVGEID